MRLNGHRERAFTYQECLELMDDAGVNRVLIVPPSWEGDRIDYALEACEAHPDRFGIMARILQNKPDEGAAMMRDFAQNPHVKGTRLTFHRPIDRNWMIERGRRSEAERAASGIPLGPKVWRELTEIAAGLGVDVPAPVG